MLSTILSITALALLICAPVTAQPTGGATTAGQPATHKASENTDYDVSSGPTTLTGALDADDSTYDRVNSTTCGATPGQDVYYDTVTFTNVLGGLASVDVTTSDIGDPTTCATTGDTVLSVYRPLFNAVDPATNCESADDDGGPGLCSEVSFELGIGESAIVVVTSIADLDQFDYQVNIELGLDPAHDVAAGSGTVTGALVAGESTYDRVDSSACADVAGNNVYYDTVTLHNTFDRLASVDVTTSDIGDPATCATTGDTVLSVYRPTFDRTDPAANCESADDDSGPGLCSALRFDVGVGETAVVVVTSIADLDEFDYQVNIDPVFDPRHDVADGPATLTGALNPDDSTYDRVDSSVCVQVPGQNVYYDTVTLDNTSGGLTGLEVTTSDIGDTTTCTTTGDTVLSVYEPAFSPLDPAVNCVIADDDAGVGLCSRLSFDLGFGDTATAVVTSIADLDQFDYQLNIDSPSCGDGIVYDDRSFEGGLRGPIAAPTFEIVQRFEVGLDGAEISRICACFSHTPFPGSDFPVDFVVRTATAGDMPGARIHTEPVMAMDVPDFPTCRFVAVDLMNVSFGSSAIFVGVEWQQVLSPPLLINDDNNGPATQPSFYTTDHGGTWSGAAGLDPSYRNLSVRATFGSLVIFADGFETGSMLPKLGGQPVIWFDKKTREDTDP